MKKKSLFICVLSAFCTSCNDGIEVRIIYPLSVEPASISFAANETTPKTATVTTVAKSWDATTTETWFTIVKQSNILQLTPTANTETSPRSGTVSVTNGSADPITVSVTQAGMNTLSVNMQISDYTHPINTGKTSVGRA